MAIYSLLLTISQLLALPLTEDEGIRRVHAHLLIEDDAGALREAKELHELFPNSSEVSSAYIEALSSSGMEEEALRAWKELSSRHPSVLGNRHLLEELSWGVLRKGINSTQYAIRLASLIGSYLTHDVRAVKILLKMMRDSNAIVRSVAIQMACSFADAPLKDEISRLMDEEKIWFVKLEVIRAAGQLRIKSLTPKLKAILASEKNTYEERQLAIEALVGIADGISLEEFQTLAKQNRAGLRHLACSLAAHFGLKEAKEDVVRLASDPNPDVRVAALNALGLVYLDPSIKEPLFKALDDTNPAVAITAAWAAALLDPKVGAERFAVHLKSTYFETRRLAAAALCATGGRCNELCLKMLEESQDPYVRANLALGLIAQRVEVKRCADILYAFMMSQKQMWMWDNRANPLFQVLTPSQVRHIDQIPNYPETIDQMTRLNLVSVLALVEDPRAQDVLKSFLQNKSWGITGVAAATLLQEGDASAMDTVRSLLQDQDPNVRLQACLVLAMMGHDESVIVELQKFYSDADHERKLHILEAIGRIGRDESYSFLIHVLEEPFQILRVAAAADLIQSVNR